MKSLFRRLTELLLYSIGCGLIFSMKHLPHRLLLKMGKGLGKLTFYTIADLRKTALTNLALAFPTYSYQERYRLAKASIEHTVTTFLELFAMEGLIKDIDSLISLVTAEETPQGFPLEELMTKQELEETFSELDQGKGGILFSGHQANWELPFLFVTKRYPGIAIAKPIKHARLSKKIFSIREAFKGKIVTPEKGMRSSLEALHKGQLVGIVGDQALLMSSYSYPLFGSPAFTTTSPALLAYKTGRPVIAVSVSRQEKGYRIVLSKKLYADKTLPMKESVNLLMDRMMAFLEKGIAQQPEQWMWMHKRWKQKLQTKFKKAYAYSHLLVVIKSHEVPSPLLSQLAQLYSGAEITLAIQESNSHYVLPAKLGFSKAFTFQTWDQLKELPNCYPAVFDFLGIPSYIKKSFLNTGSKAVYTKEQFQKDALSWIRLGHKPYSSTCHYTSPSEGLPSLEECPGK